VNGFRYLRWRQAMKRELWVLDRHWYAMLGGMWAMNRVESQGLPHLQKVAELVEHVKQQVRETAKKVIGVPNE
jgi:hypothetical protein